MQSRATSISGALRVSTASRRKHGSSAATQRAAAAKSGTERVGAVHAWQAVPAASSSCNRGGECYCARYQA